jgi:hypothetical protein
MHSKRTLRTAEMLRYGSMEFAEDCSHLTVIFSSAEAGAQLSDSVIGIGGHNTAATSAISLAACWPSHFVQVNGRRRGK